MTPHPVRASVMDLTTSGERPPIRVLVADDHTIVRGGVSQILNEQPDECRETQQGAGTTIVASWSPEN